MILLKRFLDICLFRAGPADVPASIWLMRLSVLAYFVVDVMVSHLDHPLRSSLAAALADTVLLFLFSWAMLSLRQRLSRYRQTLTAMAGTGALIGVLAWPVLSLFRAVEPHGQLTSVVLLLVVAVIFWSLAVTAHILKNALDITPGMAAIVTVGYTLLSLIVVGLAIAGVA